MQRKDAAVKAKRWFTLCIVLALCLTLLNHGIMLLQEEGLLAVELSKTGKIACLLIAAFFAYFLPLRRAHHYATQAQNKRLTIITKVLIIHYYCTVAMGIIVSVAGGFATF